MEESSVLGETFYKVLDHEGVVSIVTWGVEEPHIVNTWNSYLVVTADERILIPAYAMRRTEGNLSINPRLKMAVGSREVLGYKEYQGTGFIIEGIGKFIDSGADFDMMKEKFTFLTRMLEVTVVSAKQML